VARQPTGQPFGVRGLALGEADLRSELSAFRRRGVWLVLGTTMIGFAALFSVYSYVSPILTDLGGIPEGWVTPVLGLFGVGTTIGTLAGGRLGDRWGMSFVAVGLLGTAALLAVLAVVVRTPVAAVAVLVLFGTLAFALGPVVQNRVIEAARVPGGSLVVWTSPYAPFFGDEELALLRTLGALTGLALDRVRLFQAEHESRIALERANEVKSNFVALAAHELRTPMTTIHGFVTTLHHLSDRLDDEQREQVRVALLQQTHRMAALIEQLLDLSRLDADAIDIAPLPLHVRSQVQDIVSAIAPEPGAVTVDIAEDTIAVADRAALERIVTNLVTNAFRYGAPPVTVRAEQSDRHFRLSVEDCGTGVSAEFIPDLFERFSRSEGSRAGSVGTGLGLAIARSYARAHGGDLLYEDAAPHGAKFMLVLPAQPVRDASS